MLTLKSKPSFEVLRLKYWHKILTEYKNQTKKNTIENEYEWVQVMGVVFRIFQKRLK